jgi:uncharacterized protein YndB with AHSA1/START domain
LPAQTDRIEKDILIAAPVERVWELITRPEHLGRWFGDAGAEIDLRPGGTLSLSWRERGTAYGRVEVVEPPHRFAYRWLMTWALRDAPTPSNSTRIEFTLAAEGDGTRVAVVETGFDELDLPAAERAERFAGHTRGWVEELHELATHAGAVPAGP